MEKYNYTSSSEMVKAIGSSLLSTNDLDMESMSIHLNDAFQRSKLEKQFSSGSISICNKFYKYIQTNELKDNCFKPSIELFEGLGK